MYIGGLLFYCTGMSLMALTRARASVIIFSWAAGVMYSTLFTMPYLLVAHYHAQGTVSEIRFFFYFIKFAGISHSFLPFLNFSLKFTLMVKQNWELSCEA